MLKTVYIRIVLWFINPVLEYKERIEKDRRQNILRDLTAGSNIWTEHDPLGPWPSSRYKN